MVDNVNPTTQFHPYQPVDVEPQSANPTSSMSGLGGILNKLGLNTDKVGSMMKNTNMRSTVDSMRSKVNSKNSGMVLGGLAALVIGAGLLRGRSARTR
jgi:hypothetical protein